MILRGALQALEVLIVPAVEEAPRAAPPTSAAIGTCFIVTAAPTGLWAGKSQCLACFTSGGWRFVPPVDGMSAYVRSTGSNATFRRGAWEVASGPIASPAAGATIDTQARSAIDQILRALRQHGLITS